MVYDMLCNMLHDMFERFVLGFIFFKYMYIYFFKKKKKIKCDVFDVSHFTWKYC